MNEKTDMRKKGYISRFRRFHGSLKTLDAESRKQKADKILSVLEDFANKNVRELKNLTCLDVGCGTGLITNTLSNNFKKIVGMDIDKVAVKQTESANFVCGSGLDIPYKDGSFDIVICKHVCEYVPDAQKLFDEVYRVLKKDGFCYLSVGGKYVIIEPHYKLPFLSWMPQPLANIYLKMTKRGDSYEVKLFPYSGIRRILKKFQISDYTIAVMKDPGKYHLTDMIKPDSPVTKIPSSVLGIIEPIIPTYIFVLSKADA